MGNSYSDDHFLISELQQDNIGGQRSKIDVIATILHICMDGSLKNHIIGKGNLSDSMTNHYLTLLLYHNLLETYKDKDNNNRTYYRTTQKGKGVIVHYNEIQKLFLKEGISKLNSNSSSRYYPEKHKHAHNSTLSSYRILIIDDEADITSALKSGLELHGFKVDVFNEPVKALSNYSAGTYDLLILDVKIPKMNGFELYKVIRKLDKRIIVCFWTAFEVCYEELRRIFPAMDERYFIRKPIAMDELIDRIQGIILQSTEITNAITPNSSMTRMQEEK